MKTEVLVVIGSGAIGLAIARRTGVGKHVLLASRNRANLATAEESLRVAGHSLGGQRSGPPDRPDLFISESTASVHVSNILGKLGVAGRTEAAGIAIRLGLVPA
jgi:NAD(P)-dependent dehydrogenase (short-subunit alcohol dehydrogenase family)